ncbi:MAG: hypothetical protein LBK44_06305 [Spirochaetales bacterium]|jgi:hypothetical protein|nr:hypothetical protein [Spirochaetales bacterium]
MMPVLYWDDAQELDYNEERKKCLFEVKREKFLSEENGYISKNQLLSIKLPEMQEYNILGEIPADRPLVRYENAVDWINEQLPGFNFKNKLVLSELEGKYHALFQQYLLNIYIDTPDKQKISPSIYLRASYYGPRPALEVHFGAFRYICSNGAIASYQGVRESYIGINNRNWKGFDRLNLHSWLDRSLEGSTAISAVYRRLAAISLLDKQNEVFTRKALPIGLRKKVLGLLELSGNIEIDVESERKRPPRLKSVLLKEHHLQEDTIEKYVHVKNDIPLWDIYNDFTNSATESFSSAGFLAHSQKIHEVFTKISA